MSPLARPRRPDIGLSEFHGDGSKKTDASITATHFFGLYVDTAFDIVDHLIDGTPPCRFVLFEHPAKINGDEHSISTRDPMFLH